MKHVQPHVRGNPLVLIAEPISQVRDETHQSGGRRLQRRRCCGEALLLAERRKERHGRWTRRWRCDRTTACCNQAQPLVIARASTTPRTPFGPQPSPPPRPAQASFRVSSGFQRRRTTLGHFLLRELEVNRGTGGDPWGAADGAPPGGRRLHRSCGLRPGGGRGDRGKRATGSAAGPTACSDAMESRRGGRCICAAPSCAMVRDRDGRGAGHDADTAVICAELAAATCRA